MPPQRFWTKANNPFWSNRVAARYRSAPESDPVRRKNDHFDDKFDAVDAPSAEQERAT
jgi:hypothetical protein